MGWTLRLDACSIPAVQSPSSEMISSLMLLTQSLGIFLERGGCSYPVAFAENANSLVVSIRNPSLGVASTILTHFLTCKVTILSWRRTHIFLRQSLVRHITLVKATYLMLKSLRIFLGESPCIWCWTNKERLWWTPQSNPQDVAAQRQAAARAHLGHLGLSGGGRSWWLSRWGDVWLWGGYPHWQFWNFGNKDQNLGFWGTRFSDPRRKTMQFQLQIPRFQWFKQHDLGGKQPKRGLKQPKWGLNLQKNGRWATHTHTQKEVKKRTWGG